MTGSWKTAASAGSCAASTALTWRSAARLSMCGVMAGLLTRAPCAGRHPAVVFCNGLDSCKELLYWTRLPQALARRGISTLCVDQPGTGEALRLSDMPATPYSERWASKMTSSALFLDVGCLSKQTHQKVGLV